MTKRPLRAWDSSAAALNNLNRLNVGDRKAPCGRVPRPLEYNIVWKHSLLYSHALTIRVFIIYYVIMTVNTSIMLPVLSMWNHHDINVNTRTAKSHVFHMMFTCSSEFWACGQSWAQKAAGMIKNIQIHCEHTDSTRVTCMLHVILHELRICFADCFAGLLLIWTWLLFSMLNYESFGKFEIWAQFLSAPKAHTDHNLYKCHDIASRPSNLSI